MKIENQRKRAKENASYLSEMLNFTSRGQKW